MAQQTALSTIATPGKTQTFVAKTEAVIPKGAGPFTEMSVMALPGRIHAFAAKDEAAAPTEGTRRQRQMAALIKSRRRRKC